MQEIMESICGEKSFDRKDLKYRSSEISRDLFVGKSLTWVAMVSPQARYCRVFLGSCVSSPELQIFLRRSAGVAIEVNILHCSIFCFQISFFTFFLELIKYFSLHMKNICLTVA